MSAAPTPAVMPNRRPVLHCLRIRVDGYTYVGTEGSPEEVERHRGELHAAIRRLIAEGDPWPVVRFVLIDGREVDVPVSAIVAIEVGSMPTAVRRALVRDGVLSPLGGALATPAPRCTSCGAAHPELSTEQFFELRDRAGARQ